MKNRLIFVFVLILIISGISYLIWSKDNSVPSYILKDYSLGDKLNSYRIVGRSNSNSLEVTTQKGKGEFLVKDSNNYSSYVNKPVFVDGQYILEDGKVIVDITDIELLESK